MRAVPAGELILVPDGLGLPEAAALLHDGSTAVGLLEETGVKPGEHMLVTAAAAHAALESRTAVAKTLLRP